MNEMMLYADDYCEHFSDENVFLEFIRRIRHNAFWMKKEAKDLKLIAYEKEGKKIRDLQKKYEIRDEVLEDTTKNTALLMKVNRCCYPVRDCALQTILNRAGINGPTLKKLSRDIYAKIINDCLKAAGGDVLIRVSEEKVSGVMSGDFHDYSIMEMDEIFTHTAEFLKKNYPGCSYLYGFFEHSMASAAWELSGDASFLQAYQKEVMLAGTPMYDLKPVIRVSTSDVGVCGANIYPMLSYDAGRCVIPLGEPLYLQHKNRNGLVQYDEQLKQIYGKYQVAICGIQKLLQIPIQYPLNCMKAVMKKVGIPARYRAEAADLFCCQYGTDSCTAHDLYYGIAEVIYMCQCEGESGSSVAAMEEKVARTLHIDWTAYDAPQEI